MGFPASGGRGLRGGGGKRKFLSNEFNVLHFFREEK